MSTKLIRVTTVPMAMKYLLPGQLKYMRENGFDVLLVSADGKERQDVLRNEGCPHIIIPMTRKITPVADFRSLIALYRLFKKEKPAIVHSHTPKAGLLAMMAAKLAGVKIRIHTVAGLRFMTATGTTRKILVRMEKFTASCATQVWPNSQSLLLYIKEHQLASPAKLQVIGQGSSNGINLQRYHAGALEIEKMGETHRLLNFIPGFRYLLCVGRIVKDKGIDELLTAFSRIYPEQKDIRLVLVGTFEDDLDPISDEARNILKGHPGIIHINWSDNVEYFMYLAHLLIHPSYREGFPNVLLQAAAMHCPILCSRIEGNIDIVDHAQTGLIFEVGNADSLEVQLRKALSEPEQMQVYADRLLEKIRTQFDQRFVHESIKNKYLELLSEQNQNK